MNLSAEFLKVVLNNPNVQIEDTTRFSIGMFEAACAFTNFALDTTENTKYIVTSSFQIACDCGGIYLTTYRCPHKTYHQENIAHIILPSKSHQSTDRTEPLFDGADDTMAIFQALRSPELEVLGLTTTFGNVHTALATHNALHLKATKLRIASFVHGSNGLRIASFVHGSDGHCGSRLMPPMLGQKQASMLNIVTGSHIWVEDKDLSRVDGEVFRIDGQNAHVRTTKGKAARGYLY
ncbi:putative uridine nucleosidase 2 [Zea mays]|uniref:Putative uridine nucleosidase 2 n=1 Tax=Zea mays TaxID=4577 RepID=A0A3L6DPB1_MAIZE|nr:putative uridine nucleosidase 2 [Zea mays]